MRLSESCDKNDMRFKEWRVKTHGGKRNHIKGIAWDSVNRVGKKHT